MKKLAILLLLPFFIACSSDNDETEPKEAPQDYTSFVFETPEDFKYVFTNSVAGYYTKDGLCKKIADLGDLSADNASKEIKITIDTLVNVYFFTDLLGARRFNAVYKLEKNKKNIFKIKNDVVGIEVDKNNPSQYPH